MIGLANYRFYGGYVLLLTNIAYLAGIRGLSVPLTVGIFATQSADQMTLAIELAAEMVKDYE